MVTEGDREDGSWDVGGEITSSLTNIYKTSKEQGPSIQHGELYLLPCNKLQYNGKESEK